MLYLYYFDGKLKDAPIKFPNSAKIVQDLNKWTHKIDATNGYSSTVKRFNALKVKSEKIVTDLHVLTNCLHLAENHKYVFIPNKQFSTWVLVEDKEKLRTVVKK